MTQTTGANDRRGAWRARRHYLPRSRRSPPDRRTRAGQAGIVGTGATGAESIVVSGGYEDVEGYGTDIVSTGHDGRQNGRRIADQSFDVGGSSALLTSRWNREPVRVIRSRNGSSAHAPGSGYRYDGLFRVADACREMGRSGYAVCRCDLVKIGSDLETIRISDSDTDQTAPDGNNAPTRRPATFQRIVRSTRIATAVKDWHDHTCPNMRRTARSWRRGYAEGAHIRPLGLPHNGPDIRGNVLCSCPNCHIMFNAGAIIIQDDLTILVGGKKSGTLRNLANHRSMLKTSRTTFTYMVKHTIVTIE